MSSSSWDDMKRVREEEYFLKQEQEKLEKLRNKRATEGASLAKAEQALAGYQRGFSPLTGASMFRTEVGSHIVLEAPEEGTLLLTYGALGDLLEAAHKRDTETLAKWDELLRIARGGAA